ncbi:MAG: CPBP family intramembrane metalloprotease [Gemmatimonadaceae bacterium]|nr:CPBP family intramembrane metalloprotease [Gemmatimonadaceae bacterium]
MTGPFPYVGVSGLLYLVLFTIVVPVLAIRSARRMRDAPLPDRLAVFRSVLIQQLAILGVAWYVARTEWVPIYVAPDALLKALGLAGLATATLVLAFRPMWRRAVERGEARIQLLMPSTRVERILWLLVSLAAGIAEEVAYRGVLWVLLERLLGSSVAAAVIASLVFGVSHVLQGWRSAVVISFVALGMHGLVRATGSLLAPILVHVAYDMIAGLSYAALHRAHRQRVTTDPAWPIVR